MGPIFPIICIVVAILAVIAVIRSVRRRRPGQKPKQYDLDAIEQKAAGDWGEQETLERIKSIRRKGDYLIPNIRFSYKGEETELDILIVNRNGVFIIEVKYYHGELFGDENDEKWIEYKTFPTGEEEKFVKNPISQVKWQAGLLGKRLRSEGIRVWTEGFVYLVDENSPVNSQYVLNNVKQIDRTIHTNTGKNYDDATIKQVVQWAKRQKR